MQADIVRKLVYLTRRVDNLIKPEVHEHPGVAVYNNAVLPTVSGVWKPVTCNSERSDIYGYHSLIANTERLTVPTGYAGWHTIDGGLAFDVNAVGLRAAGIMLNGVTWLKLQNFAAAGGGWSTFISVATSYYLNVGDFVELQGIQLSGGPLNILSAGNYSPELRMVKSGD